MNTKIYKWFNVLLLLMCVASVSLLAQTPLTYTSAPLNGDEIQPGAEIQLVDPACPFPGICNYEECVYRSFIRFGVDPLVDESINWTAGQLYEVTVTFDVNYYALDGSPVSLSDQKLTVTFNNTGGVIKDQHVQTLDGGYDVQLRVTDINISPGGVPVPTSLYLVAEIEYERFIDLAPSSPSVIPSASNDYVSFNISPIAGAYSYEIEWSWVDDELVNPSLDQFDFRLNSTRVLLAPNELNHRIPNVFRKGKVITRVRAIGRRDECGNWVKSKWSIPSTGNISGYALNTHYVNVNGHLEDFNWQHTRYYAEDGKQKDVIDYADGSYRTRQQIRKLQSEDHAIAGETFYDHAGRPAVEVMPIPVLKSTSIAEYEDVVKFYPSLNENLSGEPYSRTDFEQDQGACESPAEPMNQLSGAGLYYSGNNPDQEGVQSFVPDAEGYVINQTIFTQDGSNRPRAQGGVSETLQIGSGHELKYYYGSPEQQELDRLFGNNVGYVNYYSKNLLVDANGQVAVQYKDNKDRIIAAGMAGEAPPNLDALPNSSSVATIISDLSGLNFPENEGTQDASFNIQKQFVVSGNNVGYEFDYSFQPNDFSDPECIPTECFDCVYNFKMLLYDDCNQLVFGNEEGERIGPEEIDSLCTNDGDFTHAEDLILNVGSFGLNKILGLDAVAMQEYEERYVNANICVQNILDIFYDLLVLADFSSCIDPLCAQACLTNLNPNDYTDIEVFKDDLRVCLEECDRISESDVSTCDIMRLSMIGDLSPYGQYGKILNDQGDMSTDISCISIYTEDNILGVSYENVSYVDGNGTPITIMIDGVTKAPNELTLEEFVFYFEPSWIENLLPYHPEYCYLDWCINEIDGSPQFDNLMMNTQDYDDAFDLHLLNPVGNNPASIGYPIGVATNPVPDTFFHAFPSLLLSMQTELDNFFVMQGQNYSIWDLAYMVALGQVLDIDAIIDGGDIPAPGEWDDEFGAAFCQTGTFWMIFRGIYQSKKKELEEEQLNIFLANNNCCQNDFIGQDDEDCNGNECADWEIAIPRFIGPSDVSGGEIDIDYIIDSAQDGDPDFSQLNQETTEVYIANCNGYREQWRVELQGCEDLANLSESEVNALLDQMVEICILGSDLSHPIGASSTSDPSIQSSGGYSSFGEAMEDAIAPSIFDETCNEFVISSPYPYDVNPMGGSDTELWPCACERYDAIFEDYMFETGQSDIPGFHTYLEDAYNIDYTVEELNSLACLCDNQSTEYVLEQPILLNGVLDPFACIECVDFEVLAGLYQDFLVSPDNYFIPIDELDLENTLYHDNASGWLNAQLGFNLTYHEYANFLEDHELNFLTGEYEISNGECAELPLALGDLFNEIFSSSQIQFPTSFELIFIDGFYGSILDEWTAGGASPIMTVTTEMTGDGDIYHHIEITLDTDGSLVCEMDLYGVDDLNTITGISSLSPIFPPGGTTTHQFAMTASLVGGGTVAMTGNASCYTFESCTDQLCNRPVYIDIEILPISDCFDDLMDLLFQEASVTFESQLDSARQRFRHLYPLQCLQNLQESLVQTYDLKEYHYTLFYYDQSQNLVRSIPPEGVHPLAPSQLPSVADYRDGIGSPVYPDHEFITVFGRNSFNEIVTTEIPDAASKEAWYDPIGRPLISQDGRQKDLTAQTGYHHYSYTIYDRLVRVIESGELRHKYIMEQAYAESTDSYLAWLNNANLKRNVTRTYYDDTYSSQIDSYFDEDRRYLRKRISSTLFFEDGSSEEYDYACHYDYDLHGNVSTLITEIKDLKPLNQHLKRVDYQYDLSSGNVHEIWYQNNLADAFYQRYSYDDDNRVTGVETSKDRIIWDKDANYEYYLHGPLARMNIGDKQVQGVDKIYTLQGWLKGVNSNTLQHKRDPGHDGDPGNPLNAFRASDVMSYSLGYFDGDYKSIKSFPLSEQFQAQEPNGLVDLFNGNISRMVSAIKNTDHELLPLEPNAYQYDQLNRIVNTRRYKEIDISSNTWSVNTTQAFNTGYKYDANGNIQRLSRTDGEELIDNLAYVYWEISGKRTNRLKYIKDYATPANPDDPSITSQDALNYVYDGSGNLISDQAEKIKVIEWDHTGKIRHVRRGGGPSEEFPDMSFYYDGMGNRIIKIVKTSYDRKDWMYTYYSRDGAGQILAVYDRVFEKTSSTIAMDKFAEKEFHLYGNERLGIKRSDKKNLLAEAKRSILDGEVSEGIWTPGNVLTLTLFEDEEPDRTDRFAGLRNYELSNHLGNVLSVISDNKLLAYNGSGLPKYKAEILSYSDYYPLGMLMPKRHGSLGSYRFGFNGKEMDDNLKGKGNHIDFGARGYDPRTGRWLSVDPLWQKYSSFSPYNYAINSPLMFIDYDGRDIIIAGKNGSSITIVTSLVDISVDGSSILGDFGGFYTFDGDQFIELGLDLGGLFDPTGTVDAIATGYYASKGEWGSMFISALSVVPLGDVAKLAKIDKYYNTIKTTVKVLNNKAVQKVSLNLAQRSILYDHLRKAGSKILGDALTSSKLLKSAGDQAHHIISMNFIKNNKYVGNLVANGWDINKALNGKWLASVAENGWKKAFHGNAPAYDTWLSKQINNFVEEFGEDGLQNYIEKELIPQVDEMLDEMYEVYKGTGKNMNDQFKEMIN